MHYDLEPGNFVINPREKNWGIGQVQSVIKNKATIFNNEADNSTRYGSELNNRATFGLYTMSAEAKMPVIKNEIICALQVIG